LTPGLSKEVKISEIVDQSIVRELDQQGFYRALSKQLGRLRQSWYRGPIGCRGDWPVAPTATANGWQGSINGRTGEELCS
jgi:hypothetical protein